MSQIAQRARCSALLCGFVVAVAIMTPHRAQALCLQQTMDAEEQAAKEAKEAKTTPAPAQTVAVVPAEKPPVPQPNPPQSSPPQSSPPPSNPPQPNPPSPAADAKPAVSDNTTQASIDEANWETYKCRFLLDSGRVVDTANKNVSHSEGQAWGLLLAESRGDRPAFDRIWGWTAKNLQVRPDALFAWRWNPAEKNPVTDRNDAADGDVMVAWALERASRRWPDGPYEAAGRKIAVDIRKKLTKVIGSKRLLLPGIEGFALPREVKMNLSYYVFPAFPSLQKLDPSPQWDDVRQDGLDLLAAAQFGRWKLPPDWLSLVKGKMQLPSDKPKRYSWDAIRIPLYLIWAGAGTPELLKPHLTFLLELGALPFQPAWTNLDDDSIASYGMSAGAAAVAALVKTVSKVNKTFDRTTLPTDQDYYSSSLFMLTRLAATESGLLSTH